MINNNYKLLSSKDIRTLSQGKLNLDESTIIYIYENGINHKFIGITRIQDCNHLIIEAGADYSKLIIDIYKDVILYILEDCELKEVIVDITPPAPAPESETGSIARAKVQLDFITEDSLNIESKIGIADELIKSLDSEYIDILSSLMLDRYFTENTLIDFKCFTDFMKKEVLNNPQRESTIKYFEHFEDLKTYVIEEKGHSNSIHELGQIALKSFDFAFNIETYYIEDVGLYVYTED